MQEFSFSTRIFFGEGALGRLAQVTDRRVLIVTDRFMVQSGAVDRVAAFLTRCQVAVFDGVLPDPPIEVVAAGVEALKASGAEVMIAVGGGSAIDAAKAIRSAAGAILGLDTGSMECFAVPTTSGTGSEVTDYAVITDTRAGIKYPLESRALRPPVAILDPSLTVSAPASVTADAGMDVLAHALEAYVAMGANDFSDALCEKAVALVFRFLPDAYRDGSDLTAREKLHNASCMAGLAFNSAGLGLCHGISHALWGKLHLPHGRLNAIVLPFVVAFNAGCGSPEGGAPQPAAEKYRHIAQLLELPAQDAAQGVYGLLQALRALSRSVGAPASLSEAGRAPEEVFSLLDGLISAAMADATTGFNPRRPGRSDVEAILRLATGI